MWHVKRGRTWTFSQKFSSLALTFCEWKCSTKDEWMRYLIVAFSWPNWLERCSQTARWVAATPPGNWCNLMQILARLIQTDLTSLWLSLEFDAKIQNEQIELNFFRLALYFLHCLSVVFVLLATVHLLTLPVVLAPTKTMTFLKRVLVQTEIATEVSGGESLPYWFRKLRNSPLCF